MSNLHIGSISRMAMLLIIISFGMLVASSPVNVLTEDSVSATNLQVSSETSPKATETSSDSSFKTKLGSESASETSETEATIESASETSETEATIESASETSEKNTPTDNTESSSEETAESDEYNHYRQSEEQLIRRKMKMYNSLIKVQRSRALQSPGSPQQVRHTIQQLPRLIDGTSYYAIDARLDAAKRRVAIDFVPPFDARESDEHFRLPIYRRSPPVELNAGSIHAKYYMRDCRVQSLLTGEIFGDKTYFSVVDDDETSMLWQEKGFKSTDHKLTPMKPCAKCKVHILDKSDMRYNTNRTFQVHCRIRKWVSDLLALHAGTGVFQFDFAIDDQNDKARTFKEGELERSMGRPEVWPTLPGIALDIPLTSYSHHSFRDSEFRGNPVKLNEDRKGTIAACITVSAPNSRLLLTHADQLLLHGVDHIFYLPMMKSAYGRDEHSPDLLTDPEEYFEHYLEMQNVLASRKGLITFSKPWLFPMFDVGPPHMQIFGVNSCYGHAMNMGYDWVFVLDVDEFPSPGYKVPLHVPISDPNSPPPVASREEKPLLQRILEPFDPTMYCEVRIERIRYKTKGSRKKGKYDWLPARHMPLFTIGSTTMEAITFEGLGKSIMGRDLLLATTHEGYCERRKKKKLSPYVGPVLLHSSEVFRMNFNEG